MNKPDSIAIERTLMRLHNHSENAFDVAHKLAAMETNIDKIAEHLDELEHQLTMAKVSAKIARQRVRKERRRLIKQRKGAGNE